MSIFNSIRSDKYLLLLIIFITTGCAQQTTSHAFINERPSSALHVAYTHDKKIPEAIINGLQEDTKIAAEKTIWDRLISLYALPEIENDRIEHELQQYLKHPQYLAKIQRRAEPYLYFILDEIESKQIPGELALLPIVESAFKATAVSKSRASGLWQFMPATGRLFGLKQNWWYDGRNDIYTSTQAATTYLQQLSKTFNNDWLLALASYNAGKGNIRKAIRKNKHNNLATDYWSLSLRKETMNYIPRLLALAKIFSNADKYNIPLQAIPNKPYFTIVNIGSQMDLSIAAEIANISTHDFTNLNPGFKQWSTDPDGPFHLLIHTDKADEFKEKLAHIQKKDRMKWTRHKIKAGENLGFIANKYQTTVNAIRHGNHLASNTIRAGHFLLIPTSLSNKTTKTSSTNKQLYTVKKGDTFWDIARQFSVSSKDIANWNNLSLSKTLTPGQKLIIREG